MLSAGCSSYKEALPAEDLASLHDLLEGHKVLNPPAEAHFGIILLTDSRCWMVLEGWQLLGGTQALQHDVVFELCLSFVGPKSDTLR